MKKVMRIALATIIAALCVASLAMNVAGATPPGRSGLNYFALGDKDIDATLIVIRGDTEIFRTRHYANYQRDIGGIENWIVADSATPPTVQEGDIIQIVLDLRTAEPIFKYTNADGISMYYVNSVLNIKGDYGALDSTVGASNITFYDDQNSVITSGAGPYALSAFNPNRLVQYIVFTFEVPEKTNGTLMTLDMEGITLQQNNPIYTKYLPEDWIASDRVSSMYVPYSAIWFADVYDSNASYDDGYEAGYTQGAIDAGGAPLQRWGAFLVTATSGFLGFEIYPGFPLWGLLAMAVAVPLLILFLKMFAGG